MMFYPRYSEELVRNIEALEENGVEEMRAMVNLGGEVFVQADVPDTSHIFVAVGLGFHVEFTRLDSEGSVIMLTLPDTSHIFVAVGLGFHVEFTRLEAKEFAASKIGHLRNPQTPLLIVERTSNPLPSPSPLTQFPSPLTQFPSPLTQFPSPLTQFPSPYPFLP
ncbi:unnamed protein product [Closterium sp. NIES-65]|nr:unnamed protein product [Closterium sp. NIES-65]